VLPPILPAEIMKYLGTIPQLYGMYGAQYVLSYLLLHLLHDKGPSIIEIKAVYKLLKKEISDNTMGDLIESRERRNNTVKKG